MSDRHHEHRGPALLQAGDTWIPEALWNAADRAAERSHQPGGTCDGA